MGLPPEFTATVLKQSPYRIILILSFRVAKEKGLAKKQDMRHHDVFRSKQVLQVVTSQRRAIQLRICSVLRSFPNPDADGATDAADAATLGPAAGRAEAASGAVACAGSAAMAWTGASAACSGETRAHGASGAHGEARGQARGEAIAMDLCSPPSKHPRTSCQSQGGPPCPKPQVVSTHVKPPERKELPLIDGQVPKDQGVEGMHPIDFKKFWEQSLFKFC